MAEKAFNLLAGEMAKRNMMIAYVNVGSDTTKEWEILGKGIAESAIEYNPDKETSTDILGNTETKVNKTEPVMSLEPMTVTGGSKLAVKLYELNKKLDYAKMSMFEVLLVFAFVGEAGKLDAEVHKNCTITVTSIGGSAYVDMPIEINLSNDKLHGTVQAIKEPVFTETTTGI